MLEDSVELTPWKRFWLKRWLNVLFVPLRFLGWLEANAWRWRRPIFLYYYSTIESLVCRRVDGQVDNLAKTPMSNLTGSTAALAAMSVEAGLDDMFNKINAASISSPDEEQTKLKDLIAEVRQDISKAELVKKRKAKKRSNAKKRTKRRS